MSVMQVRISSPHLHFACPQSCAVAACAMRRRQKGRFFLNRRCVTLSGHSISKPLKASALAIAEARHAKRGFDFTVSDATTAGAAP